MTLAEWKRRRSTPDPHQLTHFTNDLAQWHKQSERVEHFVKRAHATHPKRQMARHLPVVF
jgi:hypothetical protein